MKIQDLRAREIIDCKGKPLLEVDIITEDGTMGRAASPSGISAGEHEAMVLRDGDRSRYDGNGVRKAVEMAEKVVLPAIQGHGRAGPAGAGPPSHGAGRHHQ